MRQETNSEEFKTVSSSMSGQSHAKEAICYELPNPSRAQFPHLQILVTGRQAFLGLAPQSDTREREASVEALWNNSSFDLASYSSRVGVGSD